MEGEEEGNKRKRGKKGKEAGETEPMVGIVGGDGEREQSFELAS